MPKYRLDEIAINSTEKKKPIEADKDTYIGLEHLDSGCLEVTHWGADVAPIGDKLVMRKGDVLFGRRRAYQKKVAIAPFDGIFSAHGMVLRPIESVISKEFFPFFISSDYFLDAAIKISVGSLSPTINWRDLAKLEFQIPSLEEQEAISSILWAMNRLKVAYTNLLQQADALVQSQFVEMFNPVVSMQNEWAKYSLSEMADVGSSKRVFVDELKPEGVPFFRGTEVGALAEGETITPELFITEEHYETLKALSGAVTKGDLLLPSICPDGRIWQVDTDKPFYFKDGRVLWIHPKQQVINSTYLLYCLKTIFAEKYDEIASGTTFAELKIFSLKALQISLPPLELQQRFEVLVQNTDKSKYCLQRAQASQMKTARR